MGTYKQNDNITDLNTQDSCWRYVNCLSQLKVTSVMILAAVKLGAINVYNKNILISRLDYIKQNTKNEDLAFKQYGALYINANKT